jgi:hypothetical protein
MTNRDIKYLSHHAPVETYELTRKDHRDQRTAKDIHAHVDKLTAQWQAEHAADPVLREGRSDSVQRAWDIIKSNPAPDHRIMRWRVRLYCGHIAETRRHCEVDSPTRHGSSSMRCPTCGMDPAQIVAYQPLGMVAEPPSANGTRPQPRRSRRSVESRLERIEAEARDLREQLKRLDD